MDAVHPIPANLQNEVVGLQLNEIRNRILIYNYSSMRVITPTSFHLPHRCANAAVEHYWCAQRRS